MNSTINAREPHGQATHLMTEARIQTQGHYPSSHLMNSIINAGEPHGQATHLMTEARYPGAGPSSIKSSDEFHNQRQRTSRAGHSSDD